MIVGVPKEIKRMENRVALLPAGVSILKAHGHTVLVEKGAGLGSGFSDELYRDAGAEIVSDPREIYAEADMIVKVKEPIDYEYNLLRKGQIVFTYFHFAASRELTEAVIKSGCIAIAYETVQKDDGTLPLPSPYHLLTHQPTSQEHHTHKA